MRRRPIVWIAVALAGMSIGAVALVFRDSTDRNSAKASAVDATIDANSNEQTTSSTTTTSAVPTNGSQPPSPTAGESTTDPLFAALVVAPEGPRAGYDRDLFPHWSDPDRDGCNSRCVVLAAERRTDLPQLPEGGWQSSYDGYSTPDASKLDIDHMVPLAEAWDSGASNWTAERREAYANDVTDAGALNAVSAASNRSKGDKDPAKWQPPSQSDWCTYATDWLTVKVTWQLTADPEEVRALHSMLTGCA